MNANAPPLVERFRFGRITIDGREYRRDLIIFPDGVQEAWRRGESHLLSVKDLAPVFRKAPRTLIIGTGVLGSMKVPVETLSELEAGGIKVQTLSSSEACKEYNRRRTQGSTALAIHLTC